MQQFFKYLGAFCFLTIAASLAFCSMGVYQGIQTANKLFAGADNYTCRQFMYDMEQPETDKLSPMLIATAAYGTAGGEGLDRTREDEVVETGMQPAVKKVYELCKGKPAERVLNLVAGTVTGGATATVSGTVLSSPTNVN